MSDLKTVLINDSRIEDISGEISFAVQGGAQQNTYQPQSANTASNVSHTWQINVPSENIVVDRRFLVDSDVEFSIRVSNVAVGATAWNWGLTDGFGPYPLNACYLTQNTLINNCGLSVNTQDVMASLLRMNDQKIHTEYDGWTPSMVDDVYFNYVNGVGAVNNPLGTINNSSFDNKIRGRGAHPVSMVIAHYVGGVLTDSSVVSTDLADYWIITLTTHLTEPLLFLSPFISNPCVANEAGFLGINNISFNFTLDNTLKRVFRTSNKWNYVYSFGTNNASQSGFNNLRMLVNYLSVQPSQYAKISARNVLPILQYDRYITNGSNVGPLAPLATAKYSSSNVALNQIPDSILIFARIPMSQQTSKNSDSFLTIDSVSINFNNVAGILSSCSQQELWALSQKAGSSQSFNEFTGKVLTSSALGTGELIPTTGSLLVLQPAYSFNLPEYLSASSLGSYNLQFELGITNQTRTTSTGGAGQTITPEIVVITITSGYMVIHQGTAQSFSGVLNKEMVMTSKDGSAVPRLSQSDYERLVGGVRDNRGVMNMMKHFKARKGVASASPSGGVMSGGIPSGGVLSGGRLGKYIRK
jgi:hypothetical protein